MRIKNPTLTNKKIKENHTDKRGRKIEMNKNKKGPEKVNTKQIKRLSTNTEKKINLQTAETPLIIKPNTLEVTKTKKTPINPEKTPNPIDRNPTPTEKGTIKNGNLTATPMMKTPKLEGSQKISLYKIELKTKTMNSKIDNPNPTKRSTSFTQRSRMTKLINNKFCPT